MHKILINPGRKSKNKCDRVRQICQEVWTAGITAHLDLELDASARLAWVGIHAKLGQDPGPVQQGLGGSPYQTRQEK